MSSLNFYRGFQEKVEKVKTDFLSFLLDARKQGKRVAGYGAAAKGNTMMNFAGIRPDLISYVVDRNPAKQGKYISGSRIPVVSEDRIREDKPDYIFILPWNLKDEVTDQLAYLREWNAEFVVAVPELSIS